MTPEQEKLLLAIVQRFDEFCKSFVIGLEGTDSHQRRWYTPKDMFLRIVHTAATFGPLEIKIACAAIYGAVDLFGFVGTAKLIMEIRRKKNARSKKEGPKSPVSGV